MPRFSLRYDGDLRVHAVHDPSGTALFTDAPVDNHGRGQSYSPTDLVATGLGACMFTIMGIHAQKAGWPLTGATVAVEKHMTTQPPRRIARLVLRFSLPAAIPQAARAQLEQAAHTCPVALSIHPDIRVEASFAYDR